MYEGVYIYTVYRSRDGLHIECIQKFKLQLCPILADDLSLSRPRGNKLESWVKESKSFFEPLLTVRYIKGTKQMNTMQTEVPFYTSSFGFYYRLNSGPKATASFDEVVFIDVLHCSNYCFHQREGFGVMGMFISFLFSDAPPTRNNRKNKGLITKI
ncbi:hypothetical protein ACTXT7_000799 [Hymenolepis weldensis]